MTHLFILRQYAASLGLVLKSERDVIMVNARYLNFQSRFN
jgi:hypothetical protein